MTETPVALAAGNLEFRTVGQDLAAIERFIAGPAPYSSGNPVGTERPSYPTAEQELATALEGQAPMLAREVAAMLGPFRTAKLAQSIGRAVAVGIKRRADEVTTERLVGLYDVLAEGLNQITDGCTTPEDETER